MGKKTTRSPFVHQRPAETRTHCPWKLHGHCALLLLCTFCGHPLSNSFTEVTTLLHRVMFGALNSYLTAPVLSPAFDILNDFFPSGPLRFYNLRREGMKWFLHHMPLVKSENLFQMFLFCYLRDLDMQRIYTSC